MTSSGTVLYQMRSPAAFLGVVNPSTAISTPPSAALMRAYELREKQSAQLKSWPAITSGHQLEWSRVKMSTLVRPSA